jgi:hypothetical protein
MPAAVDAVPAAATGSAGEGQPVPAAVPGIVVANAEAPTAEPPEMAAQPARNEEPAAASVQMPSQTSPIPPTPINPSGTIPPQNPRRKRRAKGWSCPVCRQRKCPRIPTSPFRRNFFYPLADALSSP